MNKVKDYFIVTAISTKDLIEEVLKYTSDGWQLAGGVDTQTIETEDDNGKFMYRTYFRQAIVLYED